MVAGQELAPGSQVLGAPCRLPSPLSPVSARTQLCAGPGNVWSGPLTVRLLKARWAFALGADTVPTPGEVGTMTGRDVEAAAP